MTMMMTVMMTSKEKKYLEILLKVILYKLLSTIEVIQNYVLHGRKCTTSKMCIKHIIKYCANCLCTKHSQILIKYGYDYKSGIWIYVYIEICDS